MLDILNGLNSAQKNAVLQTEGPVLIFAGAGSGKTKTLIHRLAYLITGKKVSPFRILAVTFTNKAAQEMIKRIDNLLKIENCKLKIGEAKLPYMGTFHSICAKILRREIDHSLLKYTNNFTIYDSDDQKQLIKRIVKDLKYDPKKFNPGLVLTLISSAKSELVDSTGYKKIAYDYFTRIISEIYTVYEKRLVENNAMDFDDLLINVVKLFKTTPEMLERYQNQFQYIMVDEYQDTNEPQYQLIKLLSQKTKNICVVGDDFQSIYSWRGANFRNILNFERDFPNAKTFKLEQNYRSTENILAGAQALIKNNRVRSEKKLWTKIKSNLPVTVLEVEDENEEIDFIIREIKALRQKLNEIVVLYRTNAQSRSLEEGLIKANILYRLIGGIRFYERKEVKDIIAYLRYLFNPSDRVSMERIINVPPRGIGRKTLQNFQFTIFNLQSISNDKISKIEKIPSKVIDFLKMIDNMREKIEFKTPAEMIDLIMYKTGYKKWLDDGTIENESRLENILELKTVASQYQTFEEFLEKVALVQDTDKINSDDQAVTLMTLHSAKGLEFETVFVVGLEEGLLPHRRSFQDESELEEERRLCYVGMTRAKNRLYLIYSRNRFIFGSFQYQSRSRFIDEIAHLDGEAVEFIV
ncbi:ATP-dependent DNA helicase PcrA [Candidatus Berkelbacteria bacterium CG_4_10_14_0_8_um_filter_35_9_33_8]|uniref:DNA 3'-5' helicase n=1 Tax=Candidatus Berkelbacteria bacterium CG_4_10_14_0_2_um_filter_35_9_33_12 TaxID=1974499 RepID=A0A2M7W5L0_9BACT|nr:MAG: ATP-dependent DNA helicase PcrA [Candidatus Berkelbacteria bacterium CG23_combo_of_CG06-09_8_20_14_all_33_15]PIS08259.1 MAG: ATP-dependent DNA helicase PcrA [Candidatus Berkelbacteria bacterium CG10_big_fil_rev_8_21_14_0_10_33_10]PIZ28111.1 MAG: ATP-dependent DNA helicase PcrA [Candidatus Berkelbacteria bacterium CG_4_10_14_0_8_um_filter_35_9_33_8]PJA20899.1 MAG: ATP-dependent DNA helicase PcrA [Candidatus Berkelbacteria bacterium CG_4_10_14_0_2_um_filter_35_9_33_12]